MTSSMRLLVGIRRAWLTWRRLKPCLDKLKHPKVVALGEMVGQLPLDDSAKSCRSGFSPSDSVILRTWILPFVVQPRDALEDTWSYQKWGVGPRGGIMHSWTLEWAEKFVALGMTISFSPGVVTLKKATDIQEAAKVATEDRFWQ